MNFYILPNSHYVLLLLTLIKLIFWISAFFSTEKICTFVLQSFCLCLVLWKITPMCAWYSFSSPSHQPFCFITQPLCIFTPSWNLKFVPYHLNLVFCTKVLCKLAFFLYFISKEKFTFLSVLPLSLEGWHGPWQSSPGSLSTALWPFPLSAYLDHILDILFEIWMFLPSLNFFSCNRFTMKSLISFVLAAIFFCLVSFCDCMFYNFIRVFLVLDLFWVCMFFVVAVIFF